MVDQEGSTTAVDYQREALIFALTPEENSA
jgi:hypothetical protein